MKFFLKKRIIVSFMLIAVMASMITACAKKSADNNPSGSTATPQPTISATITPDKGGAATEAPVSDNTSVTELGTGAKNFLFDVVDKDGNTTHYSIKTDEKTVGAALLALELIEGDPGDYGLYVKKVNGIEADYDKTGTYWAFYIGTEYASSGVDSTDITDGTLYSFKVE